MANLSITKAWNETAGFVAREGRLLFPIAFLFVALPGAILQLVMPTAVPGQPVEGGLWLIMLPVAVAVSIVGTLAIIHLALRPGASVGEGIQVGARRFLPMLGAVILVGIGALILAIPVAAIAGPTLVAGAGAGAGAIVALLVLLLIAVYIFFWVRLFPMSAVAVGEAVGPIAIIKRSWNLTRGHFWKLLGFLLLVVVAAMVVMFAISVVIGILLFLVTGGPPGPDSAAFYVMLVISALVQAVISAIFATLTARIYVQLAGDSTTPEVFA